MKKQKLSVEVTVTLADIACLLRLAAEKASTLPSDGQSSGIINRINDARDAVRIYPDV